jgi:Family of unknown function (DUF6114)
VPLASRGDGAPRAPGWASRDALWRARWRQWRHTRPFLGGLLVTLGGALILLSEQAPLPLVIHVGLQGLAGYLVPVLLLLCGLLLLLHPVQRTFYSILAVVLALGSWITSNLGGFIAGLLLGVVGGALAFAWQPRGRHDQQPRPARPPAEPSAGLDLIRQEPPAGQGPAGQVPPGPGSATAILALPLAPIAPLALSLLLAPASAAPVLSAPGRMPVPSAAGSTSGVPVPPPTPRRTPVPTVPPVPRPSPAPSPTGSPSPSRPTVPSPRRWPSPSSPRPARTPTHPLTAAAPAAPLPATRIRLTAGLAVLTGCTFDGIATVRTAQGTVRMVRLSMRSLALSGGSVLTVILAGDSTLTRNVFLGFTGGVVLYATRISGLLHGARITLSPQRWPGTWHHDLALTGFTADQPFLAAGSLQASGFRASAG